MFASTDFKCGQRETAPDGSPVRTVLIHLAVIVMLEICVSVTNLAWLLGFLRRGETALGADRCRRSGKQLTLVGSEVSTR